MLQKRETLTEWKLWRIVALIIVCGIVVGPLTLLGQMNLSGSWHHLLSTGAIWLVPVFILGSFLASDWSAGIAGIALLFFTLAGYYVLDWLLTSTVPSVRSVVLWTALALMGGSLIGVTGRWWRSERRFKHVIASALSGAAFIAEGCYLFFILHDVVAGLVEVIIGVLLPLLLGRTLKDRLYALLVLPCFVLSGLLVYAVLAWFPFH